MRPVQYTDYRTKELITGKFHQWAQEDDGDGHSNPVAIVELPDGAVTTVYAPMIKFMDVQKVPKCACCGTTENLHADLGSGGPYRCSSPDCRVY